MAKKQKGNGRKTQLEFEYRYDRLANEKMVQIYQLLVQGPETDTIKIFSLPAPETAVESESESVSKLTPHTLQAGKDKDNDKKGGGLK